MQDACHARAGRTYERVPEKRVQRRETGVPKNRAAIFGVVLEELHVVG
jgi:hypothetical protein